jgi:glucokinase
MPLAIGVDIGGTKVAFALVDEQGYVMETRRVATQAGAGTSALLDRISEGIAEILVEGGSQIAGIGIGSPGQVDPVKGTVRNAVNLEWTDVALRDEIRQRLAADVPILVDKDANAAAVGELYFGAGKGYTDFVLLAIGTGLGAGCITDGKVLHGGSANALEVGHISLDINGRACKCGLRGCPEMYVSGLGLLAGLEAHREKYPDSLLAQMHTPSTQDIISAAQAKDALALAVMHEAGQWLGAIMANCAVLLNPLRFVIGGGLGHAAYHLLIDTAASEMRKRTMSTTHEGVTFALSQVQDSAVGAACLVWHDQHLTERAS